jgi:hypothetical protein
MADIKSTEETMSSIMNNILKRDIIHNEIYKF